MNIINSSLFINIFTMCHKNRFYLQLFSYLKENQCVSANRQFIAQLQLHFLLLLVSRLCTQNSARGSVQKIVQHFLFVPNCIIVFQRNAEKMACGGHYQGSPFVKHHHFRKQWKYSFKNRGNFVKRTFSFTLPLRSFHETSTK